RPGDGDALALTARQRPRPVRRPWGHADGAEERPGPRPPLRGWLPCEHGRQFDVLDRGQGVEQAEVLEHEAHRQAAVGRKVVAGEGGDVVLPDGERPGLDPLQPAQQREERGLPGPRRADERHVPTGGDVEVEVGEHRHGTGGALVAMGEGAGDDRDPARRPAGWRVGEPAQRSAAVANRRMPSPIATLARNPRTSSAWATEAKTWRTSPRRNSPVTSGATAPPAAFDRAVAISSTVAGDPLAMLQTWLC